MRPAAAFYHCKLSGEGIPDPEYAEAVMMQQMIAVRSSGLGQHCREFHAGVNGTPADALLVCAFCPSQTAVHLHGPGARSEIPTMRLIQEWVPDHPGWDVLYFHTKGVTHPREPLYENWRNRMAHYCVDQWRDCVRDLDCGHDAVGCHWLTPAAFPGAVTSPFFGGTFWWARSEYLAQLPPLPPATWENRYEAESWIGRRRPYPTIRDYHPGWPAL